ncbi:MAG: polysaccharide pyruvyl transferase family protein [Kiritimatiellae bacterium]|nr:polysaccharide pyruvyl transferase family protein [Kiritimatiellia bacterium]MBR0241098.1 polysaccharide pyruvyl transferase family protein [Kiritimatiellia bacterium]
MRIFLGGIPLGCDNIGDEAIIAGVVKMLRESIPGVGLTVATADGATGPLLGVDVAPPFGFAGCSKAGFADALRGHDAYIWCGATGLSDYPHVALDLLEIAQREGVATYVWGVGMDDELNPVFFRAGGKRRMALRCLGLLGWYERRLRDRLARRIAAVLPRCRGVWLRDPQSAAMLAQTGFPGAKVTADSAILLGNGPDKRHAADDTQLAAPDSRHALGLCISTQRQVADLDGAKGLIAAVRDSGARVLGIPMNPKTDRALLESLGVECIAGTSPEAVMEAAAKCDVVLSSRLHLLILAANAGTPGLGIARGSKLANWLSNFGSTVEGSVYDCDWNKVTEHVLAAIKSRGDWDAVRDRAYAELTSRLETARGELIALLKGDGI